MYQKIKEAIKEVLKKLNLPEVDFNVEHPSDMSFGDYSANISLVIGKKVNKNPKDLAPELIQELEKQNISGVEKIEMAGPGFINFFLSRDFFQESIKKILINSDFGQNQSLAQKRILIEHTSPNAFKLLHIGHFMANTIGESISRLFEYSGAKVIRATYASDIGLPVAKAIWGMKQLVSEMPSEDETLARKVEFMGNSYVHGAQAYESNESAKTEIDQINVHIYKKTDEEILNLYHMGRTWSLEYLRWMYQKLGTKFDWEFFG